MERTVIEAEFVTIHCFAGTRHQLLPTMSSLRSQSASLPRNLKLIFFIRNCPLKDYTPLLSALHLNYPHETKQWLITLLPVDSDQEQEQLEHLRRVNRPEFEYQYLRLQEISHTNVQRQLAETYLTRKLKWTLPKATYFLEKQAITSLEELMGYGKYPHWEQQQVDHTLQLRSHCLSHTD